MPQLTSTIALQGGLDLVTPAVQVAAGRSIGALNYEPEVRGYRRIGGFERFDGRPKPSRASYWKLLFRQGTAAIVEGDTVAGATSSAAGIALIDAVVESGSYGGSDAEGYLILYNVVGTFQSSENLQVTAVTKSVADGAAVENGALNDADNTTWTIAAIEARRSAIGPVPGSGPVRGKATFQGEKYAFRDNAGATAGKMYKASAAGWTEVTFGSTIDFSTGTAAFNEGATLTGGTSGATATIKRVSVTGGTWGTDAAGYLTLTNISGTFQNGEALTDNGSTPGAATSASTVSAITLPAGGHYEFTQHNFYGAADRVALYGCNGVGRAFEFDGTTLSPIRTGLTVDKDKPVHIAEYQNHLFLAVAGGAIEFSEPGNPTRFTVGGGAGEFSFGEDVTMLFEAAQTSLVVTGNTRVSVLTGSSSADFVLSPLAGDAGAKEWTAQFIGSPIYMDDRGVRRMSATQAFGNWRMGTLTQLVQPIFDAKKAAFVTPVASIRVRARDQYRLFFSDGTGITIYLGRKDPEILPFELPITVFCTCSGEDENGTEILLAGADDGYVYELDAGTSFDGAEVEAWLRLPFNAIGSPSQKKRFHKATLEIDGNQETMISIAAEFDYGNAYTSPGIEQGFAVLGGGGFWNDAIWNQFYWSAPYQGEAEAYLEGIGRTISPIFYSRATYEQPHVLSALTLHFTYKGMKH